MAEHEQPLEDGKLKCQTFNRALFENMINFADAVWELNVNTQQIHTLFDRMNPQHDGSVESMKNTHEFLNQFCHPDYLERMHSYYSLEFLKELKETFHYENKFLIDGRYHSLQCVMTPSFDEQGNVSTVYITTRDIQHIVDERDAQEKLRRDEHDNMIEILRGAHLGLWSFVVNDGAPRFYLDSITAEIIGIEDWSDPEANYMFWYDRIDPDFVSQVVDADVQAMKGTPAEVIYPYNHPKLGKITVRCGSILDEKYNGKGTRLKGYYQDITDSNNKLLKEIELSNALLVNFCSVVSIDFCEHKINVLHDTEGFFGEEGKENHVSNLDLTKFSQDLKPESYALFKRMTDSVGLKKSIVGKSVTSIEIETYSRGWYRITFVPSWVNQHGILERCFLLMEYINDEKMEEARTNKLLRETMEKEKMEQECLKSIASIYATTHLIDFESGSIIEINALDHIHRLVSESADMPIQDVIWRIMRQRVCAAHREKIIQFTDFSTLGKRLSSRTEISIEVLNVDDQWLKFSFVRVDPPSENLAKVVYMCQIVDELKRKEEHLILMSNTDALTGLYNRRAYDDHIAKYEENGIPENLWFIGFDVNGLKVTNDTKGHKAGDELIVGVAGVISSSICSLGELFRVGGDEFIAILKCSEEEINHCLMMMEDNRKKWKGTYTSELSFSKGIVCANEISDCTIADLEKEADKRMYTEKKNFYVNVCGDRRNR